MYRSLLLAVASAVALAGAPNTSVKAGHYDALRSILIQGDRVYAFAIRNPAPGENPGQLAQNNAAAPGAGSSQRSWTQRRLLKTVWDERKYSTRVAELNAIHDPRVEKCIVLSSVEDLKANLSRFPKDVRWASYNSEPGMTPAEELLNLAQSVRDFARAAHEAGLKVDWAPTNFMLVEDEAKFLGLAAAVDAIGLQHQRVIESQGVDAFVALTKKRAEMIRKVNPKCGVNVQVVIGRGKTEDLIEGIKRVAPFVDSADIWTMQDTATAKSILQGVRGK